MDSQEIYKWEVLRVPNNEPSEGCVCMVEGRFNFIFEWSDKIADEIDFETNTIISYKSGWTITPLPQTYIYQNEPCIKLYNTIKNGK